jgi:hypothetical protein
MAYITHKGVELWIPPELAQKRAKFKRISKHVYVKQLDNGVTLAELVKKHGGQTRLGALQAKGWRLASEQELKQYQAVQSALDKRAAAKGVERALSQMSELLLRHQRYTKYLAAATKAVAQLDLDAWTNKIQALIATTGWPSVARMRQFDKLRNQVENLRKQVPYEPKPSKTKSVKPEKNTAS